MMLDRGTTLTPTLSGLWRVAVFFYEAGNKAATDAAFANAHRVVKRRYVITRVHAQYMEPRGAMGVYDPGEDRYTLYADVQYPHRVRTALASNIFKVPEHQVRVIAGVVFSRGGVPTTRVAGGDTTGAPPEAVSGIAPAPAPLAAGEGSLPLADAGAVLLGASDAGVSAPASATSPRPSRKPPRTKERGGARSDPNDEYGF